MNFTFSYAQQRHKTTKSRPVTTHRKAPITKSCEVSGVITYFHNKFIRKRPDVGATIRFIKTEDLDSTQFNHVAYSYYMSRRSSAAAYWDYYNRFGEAEADEVIGEIYDFTKVNWNNFEAICDTLAAVQISLSLIWSNVIEKYHYEGVADGTGTYKIKVPYGKYFVLITSNNRKGIFMPEYSGRFELKRITIDKPTYILNEDFDIEVH